MSIATTRLWNALELATQQLRCEEAYYRARALHAKNAEPLIRSANELAEKAAHFEKVLAATKTEAGQ